MPDTWPEPRVTGNAQLMLGFIAGSIVGEYRVVGVDSEANEMLFENLRSRNRFRVTVRQIAGVE